MTLQDGTPRHKLVTYSKLSEAKGYNESGKLIFHFQGKGGNSERMNIFRGVPSFFRRIKRKKCSVLFPQGVSIIFMLNELTESHEDGAVPYKITQEVKEFGHLTLDIAS